MTTGWRTKMLVLAVAASLIAMNSVDAATIDIVNNCGDVITACAQSGSDTADCYVLNGGGGTQQIDVGSNWPAGAIWGFPGNSGDPATGVQARAQADLAEFTIGGSGGQDFYDISNVNAYNEAIGISLPSIAPGDAPSTQHCVPITCTIADINAFCQAPNSLTGAPGEGCYNTDGPTATSPTTGTVAFKNACPDAYSYTVDDPSSTFTCGTGTNYAVTFCPTASVGAEIHLW
ncbi:hypothetical protein KC19_7G082400 [Ceratodon purpureus]|uniref:Thaumatin-like protein n=1 Tax=Ceratodon purpureus TaxID=3225 RepID=A0A8T0H5V1_CERPU|nr:hypothetical protein KC19_7G082400 [Ceratodon purpureus]